MNFGFGDLETLSKIPARFLKHKSKVSLDLATNRILDKCDQQNASISNAYILSRLRV